MTMRRLIAWVLVGGVMWLCIFAVACSIAHAGTRSHLPPIGPFPDAECTYDSSGDIYVSPDAHFWECICERRTFIDDDCAWYDQGPLSQGESRKLRRYLHVARIPRLRVIAMNGVAL